MRAFISHAIFAVALVFAVVGQSTGPIGAQEEFKPFVARVTADQVNVRAGQSVNFERLCQLDKDAEVIIVDKQFSWYKIQLPPSAKSYVSKEYIQFLGQNAGGVTADKVNIRAGAGIHHTVVGSLNRGEQIYILEDLPEWYRIEPVPESFGWVAEEFLEFKSKDVRRYQLKRPTMPTEEFETMEEPVAEGQMAALQSTSEMQEMEPTTMGLDDTKPETVGEDVHAGGIISVQGTVEPFGDEWSHGIHFKIVAEGKPACYVQGNNHLLGRFVGQEVTVDGVVNMKLKNRYRAPVITVVKMRLML